MALLCGSVCVCVCMCVCGCVVCVSAYCVFVSRWNLVCIKDAAGGFVL